MLRGDKQYFYVVLAYVVVCYLLVTNLIRSRDGRALVAVRDHYLSAEIMGINLTKYRTLSFGLAAFFAGVGGALYAHYTTHVEHTAFGVLMATFAIAYPILGGLSSVFGTLIAVLLIQGLLIQWLPIMIGGELRNLLFGLLILLAMNLRPRGLIDPRVARTIRGLFVRSPNA